MIKVIPFSRDRLPHVPNMGQVGNDWQNTPHKHGGQSRNATRGDFRNSSEKLPHIPRQCSGLVNKARTSVPSTETPQSPLDGIANRKMDCAKRIFPPVYHRAPDQALLNKPADLYQSYAREGLQTRLNARQQIPPAYGQSKTPATNSNTTSTSPVYRSVYTTANNWPQQPSIHYQPGGLLPGVVDRLSHLEKGPTSRSRSLDKHQHLYRSSRHHYHLHHKRNRFPTSSRWEYTDHKQSVMTGLHTVSHINPGGGVVGGTGGGGGHPRSSNFPLLEFRSYTKATGSGQHRSFTFKIGNDHHPSEKLYQEFPPYEGSVSQTPTPSAGIDPGGRHPHLSEEDFRSRESSISNERSPDFYKLMVRTSTPRNEGRDPGLKRRKVEFKEESPLVFDPEDVCIPSSLSKGAGLNNKPIALSPDQHTNSQSRVYSMESKQPPKSILKKQGKRTPQPAETQNIKKYQTLLLSQNNANLKLPSLMHRGKTKSPGRKPQANWTPNVSFMCSEEFAAAFEDLGKDS